MKTHISDRKKIRNQIMKDITALALIERQDISSLPCGSITVKHSKQPRHLKNGMFKTFYYTYECVCCGGRQYHLPRRDRTSELWQLRSQIKRRRALEAEAKELTARLEKNIRCLHNCGAKAAALKLTELKAEARNALANMNRYEAFRGRYERMPADEKLRTGNGDFVRSKNELIFANMLEELGIPYLYETVLDKWGIGQIVPDFTLFVNQTVIHIELLGRLDEVEYQIGVEYKQQLYRRMRERVVYIDITDGIDIARLKQIIFLIIGGKLQGKSVSCSPRRTT